MTWLLVRGTAEVTPTWATVFDVATRAPKEVMRLAEEKGLAS